MKKKKKHKHKNKKRQVSRTQKHEELKIEKHDVQKDIAQQVEEIARTAGDEIQAKKKENHDTPKEESLVTQKTHALKVVEQKNADENQGKKASAITVENKDATQSKHVHTHHKCQSGALRKKVKSLQSYLILAIGFLLGSLYVDVAQLFTERGLSARALGEANVVTYDGATWVKYDEPKVVVDVFTETNCIKETCDVVSEILAQLHRYIPTLEARQVDVSTAEGKAYAHSLGLGYVPAFHFAQELDQTAFYTQAASLFTPREDGTYVLNIDNVDVPVEKYTDTPRAEGVTLGKETAPHTVILFENFTCESCRPVHEMLVKSYARYPEQLRVIFKNVPGRNDDIARDAAQASLCAYEQGAYEPYAQALFVSPAWNVSKSTDREKALMALATRTQGLGYEQFESCFAQKAQDEKLIADINDAERLGIAVPPVLFINGEARDLSDIAQLSADIESMME